MATKKKTGTALMTSDEEKEAAALAELTDFFDNVDVDGMEEVGGEDIKLAVKLFNMGGLDKTGNQRRKNTFFDNVTEDTQDEIECVFLLTQKTHRWDEYNNAEKKTDVLCSSNDRRIGIMADGTQRECEGCPDRGWFRDDEGKPFKKCGEVHNVVAIESGNARPFIIRFKKTSLKPFRQYLMKHHYGARVKGDGSRGNFPLYAFECKVTLRMHESGNFALPDFERLRVLSPEEIKTMHENAKAYLEMMNEVLDHADSVDVKHSSDEGDPNLSSDDFAD